MSSRPNLLRFLIVVITLLAVLHETCLLCSNIFANAKLQVVFKQCSSGDLTKTVDEGTCNAKDIVSCEVQPADGSRYKCKEFNDATCTITQEKALTSNANHLKED